jgi:hypothetical protein
VPLFPSEDGRLGMERDVFAASCKSYCIGGARSRAHDGIILHTKQLHTFVGQINHTIIERNRSTREGKDQHVEIRVASFPIRCMQRREIKGEQERKSNFQILQK